MNIVVPLQQMGSSPGAHPLPSTLSIGSASTSASYGEHEELERRRGLWSARIIIHHVSGLCPRHLWVPGQEGRGERAAARLAGHSGGGAGGCHRRAAKLGWRPSTNAHTRLPPADKAAVAASPHALSPPAPSALCGALSRTPPHPCRVGCTPPPPVALALRPGPDHGGAHRTLGGASGHGGAPNGTDGGHNGSATLNGSETRRLSTSSEADAAAASTWPLKPSEKAVDALKVCAVRTH